MRIAWSAILICAVLVASASSSSAAPQQMSFQARVNDGSGVAITDGPHNLLFTIYDATGASVWTQSQFGVPIANGLFTVMLGSATSPFPALPWDTTYTVGFAIDGGPEMTPRYTLASSPYSLDNKWTTRTASPTKVRLAGAMADSIWFGGSDTSTTGLFLHMSASASYVTLIDASTTSIGGDVLGGLFNVRAGIAAPDAGPGSATGVFATGYAQEGGTGTGIVANGSSDAGEGIGVDSYGDGADSSTGVKATAYSPGLATVRAVHASALSDGHGTIYGVDVKVVQSRDGPAWGLHAMVDEVGDSLATGVSDTVTSTGNGAVTGLSTYGSTSGTGRVTGVSDVVTSSANGPVYGVYTHAASSGTGEV